MTVSQVYFNLNKKVWSVKQKNAEGKWRVIGHFDSILAKPLKWKVQEGGRKRVIRDKQKNVHAWIECELVTTNTNKHYHGKEISYNPYYAGYFYTTSDMAPVNPESHSLLYFNKETKKAYSI